MKRYASFLTLYLFSISLSIAEEPILHLPFETKTNLPESWIGPLVPGIIGKAMQVPQEGKGTPITLPTTKETFTAACWIRGDLFPVRGINGFSDESPPTILILSSSEPNAQRPGVVVLRVRNRFLEMALSVDGGQTWEHVTGRTYLPENRWVHAAATCRPGEQVLYVDGQEEARTENPQGAGRLDRLTVGHSGGKRRFVGRMDEVLLFEKALPSAEIASLVQVEGHNPLTVPQVHPRWLRKGVLFTEHKSFPCYSALRVGDEVVHPMAEGCGILFCVVPWSAPGTQDLLIQADPTLFGSRRSLHRVVGRDTSSLAAFNGVPLYDRGETLELGTKTLGLDARGLVCRHRSDGIFDLIGRGDDMVFFLNTGYPGHPQFAPPEPLLFDGKPLKKATDLPVISWFLGDLTDDGVDDFLLVGRHPQKDSYWPPPNTSLSKPHPNVGLHRGYGIAGHWLGSRRTCVLLWAKGFPSKNKTPSFGRIQTVYTGRLTHDFPVQWRTERGWASPAAIRLQEQLWIVLFGDVKELLSLPAHLDADGELRTGDAIPFLADGASLQHTYFTNAMQVADLDGDGQEEILIGGNPGRIAVLKGDKAGQFREVGPLNVKGGWVAVDTLANPCRVKWDQDPFPDLLVGDSSGLLSFWPGRKNPMEYGQPTLFESKGQPIRHRAGYDGSLQGPGEAGWGYLNPTVADWDSDGDLDIITNDIRGEYYLYRQDQDLFDLTRLPFLMDNHPLPAAWRVRPAVIPAQAKLEGMRCPCLLFLDVDSTLAVALPREPGTTDMERIVRLLGSDGEPLKMSGDTCLSGRIKLSVADWDGDGDWDILFGTNVACHSFFLQDYPLCSSPFWMENTASNEAPQFARPRLIRLKDGQPINFRVHNCSPWSTDMNGNEELDLIMGAEDGKVYRFLRDEIAW